MATNYDMYENVITAWMNVPLEAVRTGGMTMETIASKLAMQMGKEIERNGLPTLQSNEQHATHTLDVSMKVAVLSVEEYAKMKSLIRDLEADNRDMLESIESLHETVEKSARELERKQFRIRDLEFQVNRGEASRLKAQEPMWEPMNFQMQFDPSMNPMQQIAKAIGEREREFGFRGGKRAGRD